MRGPNQIIIGVSALLSLAGVLTGIGTYNSIQRERERARSEVIAAIEDVHEFCAKAVSGFDQAQIALTEMRKLYLEYLDEIWITGRQFRHAELRRRELIADGTTTDLRLAELLLQAQMARKEAIQRLSKAESQLTNLENLTRTDKTKIDEDVSRCREEINGLSSRLARLEKLRENNEKLVQEMSNKEREFLDALKKAEEAEREMQHLQEKKDAEMRYIEESRGIIIRILLDTQESLEKIRSR